MMPAILWLNSLNIENELYLEEGEPHEYWGALNGNWFNGPNEYFNEIQNTAYEFLYNQLDLINVGNDCELDNGDIVVGGGGAFLDGGYGGLPNLIRLSFSNPSTASSKSPMANLLVSYKINLHLLMVQSMYLLDQTLILLNYHL